MGAAGGAGGGTQGFVRPLRVPGRAAGRLKPRGCSVSPPRPPPPGGAPRSDAAAPVFLWGGGGRPAPGEGRAQGVGRKSPREAGPPGSQGPHFGRTRQDLGPQVSSSPGSDWMLRPPMGCPVWTRRGGEWGSWGGQPVSGPDRRPACPSAPPLGRAGEAGDRVGM